MRVKDPVSIPRAPDVSPEEEERPARQRWLLRLAGGGLLATGWLVVAINDFGTWMFVVDTVVFALLAAWAFAAAVVSRVAAVTVERRLRLALLVRNMELENASTRDDLSQLFSRRALFERLHREMESARMRKRAMALIAIELGELDYVNRTHGYAAGDEMLAAFGRLLLGYCRASDLPARMSGRRFGIILPDTDKQSAYAIAARLAEAVEESPLVAEEPDLPVHVGFGLAGYPWAADTADDLVRQAESELARGGALSAETPSDIPAAFRNMGDEPEAPAS
jgi:diguanylate cyclase (GGDEF)-like protein